MNGVRPEFRKQLSSHDPQIDQIATFLTVAKKEQDIHEQFEKFQEMKIQPQQPYIFMNPESTTVTAVIHQRPYRHPNHSSRDLQQLEIGKSVERQQSFIPGSHRKLLKSSEIPRKSTTKQPVMDQTKQTSSSFQFTPCKICGKKNHRATDCCHKNPSDCFNCGQNHSVRDCTNPPSFQ
ncbi:unnamed protein product [Didymodactylos carnosus]|uniref:CCHC-type domain-containing protein n=1 Tax=Didymodactylos carnosus TaxID=1234261 RepID=A0A8S2DDH6_9BILA|nr:unnamed protein product [Didymodactylos carnosus]CAF3652809.1 unnamed protein product [Didymodactylos carnosus]